MLMTCVMPNLPNYLRLPILFQQMKAKVLFLQITVLTQTNLMINLQQNRPTMLKQNKFKLTPYKGHLHTVDKYYLELFTIFCL